MHMKYKATPVCRTRRLSVSLYQKENKFNKKSAVSHLRLRLSPIDCTRLRCGSTVLKAYSNQGLQTKDPEMITVDESFKQISLNIFNVSCSEQRTLGHTMSRVRGSVGSFTISGLTTSSALQFRNNVTAKMHRTRIHVALQHTFANVLQYASKPDCSLRLGICFVVCWQLGRGEPCKHKPIWIAFCHRHL